MEETVVQLGAADTAHSVTLQLRGGRLVVIAPPNLDVEVAEPTKGRKRKRQNGYTKDTCARCGDGAGRDGDQTSILDGEGKTRSSDNDAKHRKKKAKRDTRPHDLPNLAVACDRSVGGGDDAATVSILSLPAEIMQHIFLMLPAKTAARLVCVCRQWKALAEDETFWRLMFDMHFGCTPFLLSSWKSRCLQAFRVAWALEHCDVGEPMLWATRHGYQKYFLNYLKQGCDGTERLSFQTLIALAASEGHSDILKAMLTKYPGRTKTELSICNPSKYGHDECIEYLVSVGAEVNGKNRYMVTPLMFAATGGHSQLVGKLLALGATVDDQDDQGETALIYAAQNGHTQIVDTLLSHKASVDIPDRDGDTALIVACRKGHVDVAEKLLQYNADPRRRCQNGDTSLITACLNAHLKVVRLLLTSAGQETARELLDAKGMQGDTGLHAACERGHKAVVAELLSHGANIRAENNMGDTSLHAACKFGSVEIIELLLSHAQQAQSADPTADPNLLVKDYINYASPILGAGEAALFTAIRQGREDAVRLLMNTLKGDFGNSLQLAREKGGRSPLFLACEHGAPPMIVELLLSCPATRAQRDAMEQFDSLGPETILTATIKKWGTTEKGETVIGLLLREGADPAKKNAASESPLGLAVQAQATAVVDLLLVHSSMNREQAAEQMKSEGLEEQWLRFVAAQKGQDRKDEDDDTPMLL